MTGHCEQQCPRTTHTADSHSLRWHSRIAIAGGALCSLTFIITLSTMLSVPIWEAESGGFPWLNHYGSFLIKDTALLGISLMILAQGLAPAGTAASR
ncbi:DUF417 family protein [Pseudomonas sp. MN1F]|uniref:DUF417 family protein n=1 Tax=Pseudomonas sp. MN1F TaxID=1366632 RepID=UPI00128EFFFD|nr:DUF417 family protein [Pseudomonas sp. MN1F]MQG91740.1 DUF417 family protein [Pseudomonas sp. MN1F]